MEPLPDETADLTDVVFVEFARITIAASKPAFIEQSLQWGGAGLAQDGFQS